MQTSSRTPVYFDPGIHRALRLKAAATDRSISELVNEAVGLSLSEDADDLARISHGVSKRNGSKPCECKASEGSAPQADSTVRRGAGSEATQQARGFQSLQPTDRESGLEAFEQRKGQAPLSFDEVIKDMKRRGRI